MKKKTAGKICSAALAALCAVTLPQIPYADKSAYAEEVRYEFEDGELNLQAGAGAVYDSTSDKWIDGASGKFVFFANGGESAAVKVNVEKDGVYNIKLCYSSPYGDKIEDLYVNGTQQASVSLAETSGWETLNCGNVQLKAGENEIKIVCSWGWVNIDYLTVSDGEFATVKATDTALSDPKATKEASSLYSYLMDVYGSNIISGQQEIYKYGHGGNFEQEFDYLKDLTGDLPAIRGFDFLNCANILYGDEDGTVDRMIEWANNKNGIVTASWHVTVPKNFANYEQGVTNVDWNNATYAPGLTDFDTAKVLEEGSKENKYYMACLEALAAQMKKAQDAGVPIIFRPLHEAEGGGGETGSWFWWGKDGSKTYKGIWQLTYETLTEKYDLHNIIWEWNSYAYATSADWYPGDEYVDIVAYDKYNCTTYDAAGNVSGVEHNVSAIGSTFYNIMEKYNCKKMVAMAENDSVPTLKNLLDEKAAWLYFCTWYDGENGSPEFLSDPIYNAADELKELYQSDYCITLSELPKNLYSYTSQGPDPTDAPTEAPTDVPTDAPTEAPTDEPTEAPTEEPTPSCVLPTDAPTEAPTDEPTSSGEGVTVDTSKEATKWGDVDCNGDVDSTDIVCLNKFLLNPEDGGISEQGLVNANCEFDNVINMSDSGKLVNYVAEIIKATDLGKK